MEGLVEEEFVAEFLAVAGLVVLEPVKDAFALDVAVEREMSGDLLNLVGGGGAEASSVQLLKHHHLLRSWAPSSVAHFHFSFSICMK